MSTRFVRDFSKVPYAEPNSCFAAALDYAAQGWPVVPLNGKAPRVKDWPRRASTSPKVIAGWWKRWPNAGVGVVTGHRSGVVVVDVDMPDGEESLRELEKEYGRLPPTLESRTPSGGRHLVFTVDTQLPSCQLAPNVDFLAEGRQFAVPAGPGARQWGDETAEPVPLPGRWVAAPQRASEGRDGADQGRRVKRISGSPAKYAKAALVDVLADLRALKGIKGNRNIELNNAALRVGHFVGGGYLDEEEVRGELEAVVHEIGLRPDEVATVNSGLSAGIKDPITLVSSQGADEDFAAQVEKALLRLQVTEEAKKRLRELTHPPVPLPRRTLADLLTDTEREPAPHRVDGLHKVGHNTTVTAQYKTGKTTFFGNLARCLVDDKPFLDRFEVLRPTGRVGWLNYELTEDDQTEWLADMGIIHADAIALLNLRGSKFTLVTDAGRAELARWCRDQDVEVLLLDTYRRARRGFGEENSNTDADEFTATLDEIKTDAGVLDLWLTVHTGRGENERARGATALDDWADNRWILIKNNGVRYFRADDGRSAQDADANFSLDYDPVTRILTAGTNTLTVDLKEERKAKRMGELQTKILYALSDPETERPISLRPLHKLVGGNLQDFNRQCFVLCDQGKITMEKEGNSWRIDLSENQRETMGVTD